MTPPGLPVEGICNLHALYGEDLSYAESEGGVSLLLRTAMRRARFAFSSDQPGSKFQCKLIS